MAQEKDISFRQEDPSWIFELFFVMNFEFNFGKPEIVDANLPTVLDFRCDKVIRMQDLNSLQFLIFHSEFQTSYESDFYYRNKIYEALLENKFRLNVIQMLFNLMPTSWNGLSSKSFDGKTYWFRVFNFCEHSAESFLSCENPFNVISAILGFTSNKVGVMEAIVKKLNDMKLTEQQLRIYANKLEYLCDYRDLYPEFNFHKNMFDIKILTEKDKYQMALDRGRIEGEKKLAINLYRKGKLNLREASQEINMSEVEFLTLLNNPEYK